MEYISRKFKKEYTAIKNGTKLPMDWVQKFLYTLHMSNEKFIYPLPCTEVVKAFSSTDVDFLLILSDTLMEYIMEMNPIYISKIDSYIQEYRNLMTQVYHHTVLNSLQMSEVKSILNLS